MLPNDGPVPSPKDSQRHNRKRFDGSGQELSRDPRARARRGLLIYCVLVAGGAGTIEAALIRAGGPVQRHLAWVAMLMWIPAVASVACRLILREGMSDAGLRVTRTGSTVRQLLVAWLFPIAVGVAAYVPAWGLGLVEFQVPQSVLAALGDENRLVALLAMIGLALSAGTLTAAVLTLGEEIGWRGYMLTRLFVADVRRPVLLSGVIWAAFHVPLILSGQYAAGVTPVTAATSFVLTIVSLSYVAAKLRLASGSVWPPVLFHASWNAAIQGCFDAFVPIQTRPEAALWIGESGLLVVAASGALAWLYVKRPFVWLDAVDGDVRTVDLRGE